MATMASRTLEQRFERMSVNDENDPGDGTRLYTKSKVCIIQCPIVHLAVISQFIGYCDVNRDPIIAEHEQAESVQSRTPVAKYQHRPDSDTALAAGTVEGSIWFQHPNVTGKEGQDRIFSAQLR